MRIRLQFVAPVALAFMLGVYGQALAQDKPAAPRAPDAPAGQQAQAPATASGELLDVDAKNSMITVKTADAEMRFKYDDQTKVSGAQKAVAGLATSTGSQVTVQYRKDGATNIATSIDVRAKQ